jgi:glycosyltransferase involved in cell wall biosynthesis
MNILYLTNHLNIGGITSYVLTLATGLKKRGHNVYIASSGGALLSRFTAEGIIYIPIPIRTKQEVSLKILFSMFKLSGFIKQNNINLAHSNSRTTQVLACLLQRRLGIPHISTCHGFFKKKFFRKIFPCWGKKVIAISESVKEHLIKDFRVDEKNIVIIHNGIDIERFREPRTEDRGPRKKNLGLGDGPVVGIVARLSDVKGHIYLIEAMAQVLKNIPDAQLLIVGDGKMKQELLSLTLRLGIEKSVFFIPSVLDTQEVLSLMDIFVMPSLKEGLGLALMEAMARGLAVIGSDIGGIRSLIKDGLNGLLVKPADAASLSNAILELLQDEDRAKSLGEAARVFIKENFSQEKMVLKTEEVYLECVGAKD